MRHLQALVIAAFALCFPACGGSPTSPPFSVEGCVIPGVEVNCVILKTDTGAQYQINSASPPPELYSRIRATIAVEKDKASVCMQGTIVSVRSWEKIGTCPVPGELTGY